MSTALAPRGEFVKLQDITLHLMEGPFLGTPSSGPELTLDQRCFNH